MEKQKTLVIAEIGVNHGGRLDHALALIRAAKDAGADAAKFQMFQPALLCPGNWERQAMLKGLALTREELTMCAAECGHVGIEFMCTPMDSAALVFLTEYMPAHLRPKRLKIGSGQAMNRAFAAAIATYGLPVIMSTGMNGGDDTEDMLNILGTDVTLLYCVSKYPTPDAAVSLAAMNDLRKWGLPVGISSHCRSFWPTVAAVYAGAVVTENHICLPGTEGPDVSSSLLPEEFGAMVREIRGISDGK